MKSVLDQWHYTLKINKCLPFREIDEEIETDRQTERQSHTYGQTDSHTEIHI